MGIFRLLFLVCVVDLVRLTAAGGSSFSFKDNFDLMWAPEHFSTSKDGQTWYLTLDKKTGCGFQTKNRYRFGWFSMKLKLVGGDSAGVVTAYYMISDTGPKRDELDFEFLGNRSGQPYTLQTNIYKGGVGGREMRHTLWFFVDRVPIRIYRNTDSTKDVFPNEKPMYMFSSIWNADDWATRGGLEKTDWKNAPFVSAYKDFHVEACQWEDPYPSCVSTTTENWWDQYDAWILSDAQKVDFSWVGRNLVIYDYCKDYSRYPKLPAECSM